MIKGGAAFHFKSVDEVDHLILAGVVQQFESAGGQIAVEANDADIEAFLASVGFVFEAAGHHGSGQQQGRN